MWRRLYREWLRVAQPQTFTTPGWRKWSLSFKQQLWLVASGFCCRSHAATPRLRGCLGGSPAVQGLGFAARILQHVDVQVLGRPTRLAFDVRLRLHCVRRRRDAVQPRATFCRFLLLQQRCGSTAGSIVSHAWRVGVLAVRHKNTYLCGEIAVRMGPDELLWGLNVCMKPLPGEVVKLKNKEARQLTISEAFERSVRRRTG